VQITKEEPMGLFSLIKNMVAGSLPVPGETIADHVPGSPELYSKCLSVLLASDLQQFITVSEHEGDACIQVAKGDDLLSLNIASYPFTENPEAKLAELDIVLPPGSTMQTWEAESFCQYGVPVSAIEELSTAIDAIFRKMHGKTDGYTVSVHMEN
jgi:hypothetical protein